MLTQCDQDQEKAAVLWLKHETWHGVCAKLYSCLQPVYKLCQVLLVVGNWLKVSLVDTTEMPSAEAPWISLGFSTNAHLFSAKLARLKCLVVFFPVTCFFRCQVGKLFYTKLDCNANLYQLAPLSLPSRQVEFPLDWLPMPSCMSLLKLERLECLVVFFLCLVFFDAK